MFSVQLTLRTHSSCIDRMVKKSKRSPLRDITVDALRRSRRINGVAKVSTVNKGAPILKNATNLCKVEVKQGVAPAAVTVANGKRRKCSTSSRTGGWSPKKKKLKLQPQAPNDSKKNVKTCLKSVMARFTISSQPIISVPAKDLWLCEPTLADDIYAYTKSLESRHFLPVNYLAESGSRVTNEMRATLVNWLVEIHGHLKLEPETLYVAVKLLDTTLHRFNIGVTRLQLCGLAVFWIASKLENNPPTARELLQLMCYTGDSSILVRMEEQVLKVLDFRIQVADPIFFLNRLLIYDANGSSVELLNTCCYLMDSLLHDASIVEISPSDLASSALLAARYIDGSRDWPLPLAYATGHWPTPDPLRPLAVKMVRTVMQVEDASCTYSGAYRKYSSRKRFYALSKSEKFRAAHLLDVIDALQSTLVHFSC